MNDLVKIWHFFRYPHPLLLVLLSWLLATKLVGSWSRGAAMLATLWLAFVVRQFVQWRKARRKLYADADLKPAPIHKLAGRFVIERLQAIILQAQWRKACEALKLQTPIAKSWPKLKQVRGNLSNDFSARIYPGAYGLDVDAFQKNAAKFAGIIRWGCKQVTVTIPDPGNAKLEFSFSSEFERILPLSKLKTGPAGTLVYGIRRDGTPAFIWSHMSVMIGGLTRKGKSVVCKTLIASAHKQKLWLDLYIADTKNGIELAKFEKQLGVRHGTVRVVQYAQTPEGAEQMVKDMVTAQRARGKMMRAKGIVQWKPTAEHPQLVGIFDETLPLHEMLKAGTKSPAGEIAFAGAAECVSLWINTQMGHASVIGALRELVPQRISFSTTTWQATETILGSGAWTEGSAGCHKLGNKAGLGWSGAEDEARWSEFRSANCTPDDYDKLARGVLPKEWSQPAAAAGAPLRERFVLYRIYDESPGFVDAAGTDLAYVGISNDFDRREREHFVGRQSADWKFCPEHDRQENYWLHHAPRPGLYADGDLVVEDGERRIEITALGFITRKEAEREEKLAIKTEHPYFNAMHNGDRVMMRTRLRGRLGRKGPRLRALRPVRAPQPASDAVVALRPGGSQIVTQRERISA